MEYQQNKVSEKELISQTLIVNKQKLNSVFSNCSDISMQPYHYGPELSLSALVIYCKTMVQEQKLNYLKSALQDLVSHEVGPANTVTLEEVISFFERQGVSSQSPRLLSEFNQAVEDVLNGYVVIFFDNWDKALSFQAISVETRSVSEPISESVVKGPHEGTVENLQKNIGLIRARLKTPHLKFEMIKAGKETNTDIAFAYLENAVDPETLAEFKKRILKIDTEEVLETSYIEELIEDSTYSPFPQYRYTERPDVVVASLLDGKIAVLVQGTGSILICPGLFVDFLQSSEDYYQRTVISSLIRIMRIGAFFIALSMPSIYVALSTFHPELIPKVLLLAMADSREGVPFPTFFEALLMELSFELLREAGIRLPKPVGSAVSIVGALVIGEAAITARIASPIMVVIVAVTGIASFSIPHYNMGIALRILRFPLMALSAMLGGFGFMIGCLLILLHLTHLRSLGQPYLGSLAPLRPKALRDIFVRAPKKILFRSPRNHHMHKSANKGNQ